MKPRKSTTRATLPAAEWAFHKVPESELEAATEYEYQREAALMLDVKGTPQEVAQFWAFYLAPHGIPETNDPKQQKPWTQLPAAVRARCKARRKSWERHKADGALAPLVEITPPKIGQSDNNFAERVVFDVDWRAKDKALLKQFAAWLEQGRKAKRGFLSELRPHSRTGPKTNFPALCDLVIWRARRAGLTMKATRELMHPFLSWAGGIGKVINPIQRARACQNAQQKIEGYAAAGARAFYALPKHRPIEDWIALAAGRAVPSLAAKLDALNKVPKRNRGK